ncbi:MFS transporter [Streptomyces sp. NPDC002092]
MALPRSRFAYGYGRLWAATTASGVGDGTRTVALALYAATLTHDPFAVALVTVAGKLPWTCVGPFAGALVDRLDRWRTLWICDVARALVTTSLVLLILTGRAGITVLAAVSFVLTSITTLAENLSQAVVSDVVGDGTLESANSRLMGGQLVSSEFLGAPLGTALFALGHPVPFALDTLSFAVSAALVCSVRLPGARPAPPGAGGLTARAVVSETAEGIRWLWRHRVLRTVCVLVGALNFAVVAVLGIAVLYALNVLHISQRAYGMLLVVLAVGGLAGVLLAPVVTRVLGRARTLQLAFALCPLSFLIAGTTSRPLLAAGALAFVGAAISLATVVTTSLRQALVPGALFGRVNGGYRFVVNGVSPLGGLAGGAIAGVAGLRAPFLLAAALLAAATVTALLRLSPDALDAAGDDGRGAHATARAPHATRTDEAAAHERAEAVQRTQAPERT